ncbi:MAG: hypothetical protein DRP78_06865 [Candidatus Omnitrophota bacterium]|nr:MAG: hypothetical protein DRP78_06865 [Candidatus Omnitrophota bacterium]
MKKIMIIVLMLSTANLIYAAPVYKKIDDTTMKIVTKIVNDKVEIVTLPELITKKVRKNDEINACKKKLTKLKAELKNIKKEIKEAKKMGITEGD